MPWIQAISNHLWYSASTCGNADLLHILYHIVNKHQWDDLCLFHKCGHPEMSKRDENSYKWLNSGSPAHVALEEVVTNKKLLKDLAKLTEFHHTGELG